MAEAMGKTPRLVEWSGDDIKGTTCQPETMILWEGIELIGCPRGTGMKTQIVQGVIYTVVYIDDQTVVLQMRKEYTERLNPEDEDDEVKQHDGIIADKFDDEETGIRWATVFFTDNEQRQVKLSQCYPTAKRAFSYLTGCFATVAADGMDIAIERAGQLCQVADSAATAMKRGLPMTL